MFKCFSKILGPESVPPKFCETLLFFHFFRYIFCSDAFSDFVFLHKLLSCIVPPWKMKCNTTMSDECNKIIHQTVEKWAYFFCFSLSRHFFYLVKALEEFLFSKNRYAICNSIIRSPYHSEIAEFFLMIDINFWILLIIQELFDCLRML